MVTAGTLRKERLFKAGRRLQMLHDTLLRMFAEHGWHVEAWAVFENHYHVVVISPPIGLSLREILRNLHSATARELNSLDGTPGRQVWFQYWDSCVTFETSYYARLRYVMTNPAKHGLVQEETSYPWGCAWWFERNLDPSRLRRIKSYRCERVRVPDDF